jgi:hypothetical protein
MTVVKKAPSSISEKMGMLMDVDFGFAPEHRVVGALILLPKGSTNLSQSRGTNCSLSRELSLG